MSQRYDQCDSTCTTDCGHCKGQGPPPATEVVPMEYVAAGDSISVQDGREGSFFTIKSIRDGLRKGRGFRTTEGEYTTLPWGYPVTRVIR